MSKRTLVVNQPAIGKLVRELRQEIGLTQEQFAAKLGVTYPTINRWENGRSTPSPLAFQKIEEMLHSQGERGKDLLTRHFSEEK